MDDNYQFLVFPNNKFIHSKDKTKFIYKNIDKRFICNMIERVLYFDKVTLDLEKRKNQKNQKWKKSMGFVSKH